MITEPDEEEGTFTFSIESITIGPMVGYEHPRGWSARIGLGTGYVHDMPVAPPHAKAPACSPRPPSSATSGR